ncbi:hypothetical protein HPB47_021130 [Ixodes persulcatus]|uniref:Uncharacterized protein n=1 Tax=Ixodes persulcatus TaxID=34615 RepID=A0AC60QFL7_IXOPE|nr:hypothetical protein HPB47_021130 [Ixodes persulcatus]
MRDGRTEGSDPELGPLRGIHTREKFRGFLHGTRIPRRKQPDSHLLRNSRQAFNHKESRQKVDQRGSLLDPDLKQPYQRSCQLRGAHREEESQRLVVAV